MTFAGKHALFLIVLTVFFPFQLMSSRTLFGDDSIDIRHAYSLGNSHLDRRWLPVYYDIRNRSDSEADLSAVFTLQRRMYNVHYRRNFFVPPNMLRRLDFPVQFTRTETFDTQLLDETGRRLYEYEIMSNALSVNRSKLLRIDDEDVLPSFLDAFGTDFTYPPGRGRPVSSAVRIEYFPEHLANLDSFEIIMVGGMDYQAWRPGQVQTLKEWVMQGGVLLMAPTVDSVENGLGLMEDLMPAIPYGVRKEKNFTLDYYNEAIELSLDSYVEVLDMENKEGVETVLSNNGLPVLVKKQLGLGEIYAFAFSGKVINQMDIDSQLLLDVMEAGLNFKPTTQSRLYVQGAAHMDQVAGTEVPARMFVFGFLGGFGVLAIVALSVTHWIGRGELGWPVLLPAGFIIMVVAIVTGASYREDVGLSLNEIAVLHGQAGSSSMTRDALIGLYTPKSLRATLKGSPQPGATLTAESPTAADEGRVTHRNVKVGDQFSITGLRLSEGEFPRFQARTPVSLKGPVNIDLEFGKDGLTGQVENTTDMRLEGGFFAVNGYPFPIGDLAPNEVKSVDISDRSVGQQWNFTTRSMLGTTDIARKDMLTDVFKPASVYFQTMQHALPWQSRLFFVAWAPEGENFIDERLEMDDEQDFELIKRSRSLLCIFPDIRLPQPGMEIKIPGAMNSAAFRISAGQNIHSLVTMSQEQRVSQLELHFFLPKDFRRIALKKGELNLHLHTDHRGRISVFGMRNGEKEKIDDFVNVPGGNRVDIPDIFRFYGEENHVVRLFLSVDETTTDAGGDHQYLQGAFRLRDAYLSVEGVTE